MGELVSHTNIDLNTSGLVVNPLFPYLCASPDGMIMCTCCVSDVIEFKCPHSASKYPEG